ncbi:MAG: ATP-dependent RecD-like DNA helicase [Clostridiales bacterium]|jgi:exodeoxyribonuclease V alpha subunit|nr:ATP-dependent RecD-like DNA helicase [Clostridiales bacterium]
MVIKGSVDEIRFRNEENGYTILTLDAGGEAVTCVGAFPPVSEGETVSVEGEYVTHQKFGRQFKAAAVKVETPDTLDGVIRYLGSGLIKGVGPKTALAIAALFKEKTFEVIEFSPYMLSRVKGISKSKALQIGAEYAAVKQMKDAVIFLSGNGVSTATAIRIYKKYGEKTRAVIETNPYLLIEEVDGIGFITADRIAAALGIKKDGAFRVSAGIIHTLNVSGEKNGNTCLPRSVLTADAAALLELDAETADGRLEALESSGKIKSVRCDFDGTGEKEYVMTAAAYSAESRSAGRLVGLAAAANRISYASGSEIGEFERIEKIELHPAQREAVTRAVNGALTVITGGPGTGKTTIIKCVLSVLGTHGLTFSLMAPTGRAAKRLSEATGVEAATIHRTLMLGKGGEGGGEALTADAVIIDEVSMVDVYLLSALLSRVRDGAKLILVGDKDQLPSVGAGNVLADIMKSFPDCVVNLTQIYRQSERSLITLNAHAVNEGRMPELASSGEDFFFVRRSGADEIAPAVVELAARRIPKYLNADPSRVQILCPLKSGAAGSVNLNALMQKELNGGPGPAPGGGEQRLRRGDRVMHTVNNYDLEWEKRGHNFFETGRGVFNGDLGYITGLGGENGETEVTFEDGRVAVYTSDARFQLSLAYAMTVHKSQGSEFDAVILPVCGGNPAILTRNLLYTAITRAKKIVILVGEEYNIRRMVDNNYIAKRYSMLSYFIQKAARKYSALFGGRE